MSFAPGFSKANSTSARATTNQKKTTKKRTHKDLRQRAVKRLKSFGRYSDQRRQKRRSAFIGAAVLGGAVFVLFATIPAVGFLSFVFAEPFAAIVGVGASVWIGLVAGFQPAILGGIVGFGYNGISNIIHERRISKTIEELKIEDKLDAESEKESSEK